MLGTNVLNICAFVCIGGVSIGGIGVFIVLIHVMSPFCAWGRGFAKGEGERGILYDCIGVSNLIAQA